MLKRAWIDLSYTFSTSIPPVMDRAPPHNSTSDPPPPDSTMPKLKSYMDDAPPSHNSSSDSPAPDIKNWRQYKFFSPNQQHLAEISFLDCDYRLAKPTYKIKLDQKRNGTRSIWIRNDGANKIVVKIEVHKYEGKTTTTQQEKSIDPVVWKVHTNSEPIPPNEEREITLECLNWKDEKRQQEAEFKMTVQDVSSSIVSERQILAVKVDKSGKHKKTASHAAPAGPSNSSRFMPESSFQLPESSMKTSQSLFSTMSSDVAVTSSTSQPEGETSGSKEQSSNPSTTPQLSEFEKDLDLSALCNYDLGFLVVQSEMDEILHSDPGLNQELNTKVGMQDIGSNLEPVSAAANTTSSEYFLDGSSGFPILSPEPVIPPDILDLALLEAKFVNPDPTQRLTELGNNLELDPLTDEGEPKPKKSKEQ
ncbi:unnamed protein product, partial [Mesorhabditis belari]|uniref:Uncharacterized protein n=1 Tax=Mesorhabditis belari TaxID=2138241 RepID=A0AAF3FAJ3_9BILA